MCVRPARGEAPKGTSLVSGFGGRVVASAMPAEKPMASIAMTVANDNFFFIMSSYMPTPVARDLLSMLSWYEICPIPAWC